MLTRWPWPLLWLILTALCGVGTGVWLHTSPEVMDSRPLGPPPVAGTLFPVHTETGSVNIWLADANNQWNWNWTTPECLQALATWARADQVGSLTLELADPATHPLGLPIRSLYPEEHIAPGMAGAWCETRGPEDQPDLLCSIAPLTGTHPAHLTVAMMGALAQAGAYAQLGEASLAQTGQVWSWSRWHPLVHAGPDGVVWRSACPTLSPQIRRFP